MKRLFILGLCLLSLAITAHGQNSAAAKARVTEIRKMYAAVKEGQEYRKMAEIPPDVMVINNDYMAAGAGPIKETYHYYYSGDFDEDLGREVYETSFITRKYNVGASEYYEEILFDDKGLLAFFYEKGPLGESRYYFDNGKVVHFIKSDDSETSYENDPVFLFRYCDELRNAFNLLMNRDY